MIADDFDYKKDLPLWSLDDMGKAIKREFVFANFKEAFEFMSLCAQYAEQINHHPDWSNSWNKVSVKLTTHSAHHLTSLDIQLAKAMDMIASKIQSS